MESRSTLPPLFHKWMLVSAYQSLADSPLTKMSSLLEDPPKFVGVALGIDINAIDPNDPNHAVKFREAEAAVAIALYACFVCPDAAHHLPKLVNIIALLCKKQGTTVDSYHVRWTRLMKLEDLPAWAAVFADKISQFFDVREMPHLPTWTNAITQADAKFLSPLEMAVFDDEIKKAKGQGIAPRAVQNHPAVRTLFERHGLLQFIASRPRQFSNDIYYQYIGLGVLNQLFAADKSLHARTLGILMSSVDLSTSFMQTIGNHVQSTFLLKPEALAQLIEHSEIVSNSVSMLKFLNITRLPNETSANLFVALWNRMCSTFTKETFPVAIEFLHLLDNSFKNCIAEVMPAWAPVLLARTTTASQGAISRIFDQFTIDNGFILYLCAHYSSNIHSPAWGVLLPLLAKEVRHEPSLFALTQGAAKPITRALHHLVSEASAELLYDCLRVYLTRGDLNKRKLKVLLGSLAQRTSWQCPLPSDVVALFGKACRTVELKRQKDITAAIVALLGPEASIGAICSCIIVRSLGSLNYSRELLDLWRNHLSSINDADVILTAIDVTISSIGAISVEHRPLELYVELWRQFCRIDVMQLPRHPALASVLIMFGRLLPETEHLSILSWLELSRMNPMRSPAITRLAANMAPLNAQLATALFTDAAADVANLIASLKTPFDGYIEQVRWFCEILDSLGEFLNNTTIMGELLGAVISTRDPVAQTTCLKLIADHTKWFDTTRLIRIAFLSDLWICETNAPHLVKICGHCGCSIQDAIGRITTLRDAAVLEQCVKSLVSAFSPASSEPIADAMTCLLELIDKSKITHTSAAVLLQFLAESLAVAVRNPLHAGVSVIVHKGQLFDYFLRLSILPGKAATVAAPWCMCLAHLFVLEIQHGGGIVTEDVKAMVDELKKALRSQYAIVISKKAFRTSLRDAVSPLTAFSPNVIRGLILAALGLNSTALAVPASAPISDDSSDEEDGDDAASEDGDHASDDEIDGKDDVSDNEDQGSAEDDVGDNAGHATSQRAGGRNAYSSDDASDAMATD